VEKESVLYPYYREAWRRILVDWLGWAPTRFDAWVARWEYRISHNIYGYAGWFYHEDEFYHVLPLLVPEELDRRLESQAARGQLRDELHAAVIGALVRADRRPSESDWSDAKEWVEAVLNRHAASLPTSSEVSDYESRTLGAPSV
jgi:hypothetical protein